VARLIANLVAGAVVALLCGVAFVTVSIIIADGVWGDGNPDQFWVGFVCLLTFPVGLIAGAMLSIRMARAATPKATHVCPACGYDLRGTPGPKCPECGAEREAKPA
jgi:hypothetical protein